MGRNPVRGAKLTELIDARLATVLGGESADPPGARADGTLKPRGKVPAPIEEQPEQVSARPLPGLRFGSRQAGVIAVLLFVAVALTWWWVSQSDAASVPVLVESASPATTPATSTVATAPTPTAAASASEGGAGILVHVVGAVKRPGVVELPAGARVQAAIEEAGGLASDAELGQLNLAAPVTDGAQVVVGSKSDPTSEVRAAPQSAQSGDPATGLVNINTATSEQLQTLPGVGPVTADAIIGWREAQGSFARIEDLLNVDGIGDKTLAKLVPLVTV